MSLLTLHYIYIILCAGLLCVSLKQVSVFSSCFCTILDVVEVYFTSGMIWVVDIVLALLKI